MAKRGRPPRIEAEIKGDLAQMREQVTLKFFGLSEKVYKHLVESVVAMRPCGSCTVDQEGNHKPGKAKDENGLCALCHGTYLIPDNNQRNWAASEALPLITQAKPVEMKIDAKTNMSELEEQYKSLPDALLSKLLTVVEKPEVVDVEPSQGTSETPGPAEEGSL